MTHSSVWEHVHDHTQRVTEEKSQRVIECFHIESDAISKALDVSRNKGRNYVNVRQQGRRMM